MEIVILKETKKTNKNNTLAVDATLNNIQQKLLRTFFWVLQMFVEKK